jgi:hypothetical protein
MAAPIAVRFSGNKGRPVIDVQGDAVRIIEPGQWCPRRDSRPQRIDRVGDRIYVAVHGRNELVTIVDGVTCTSA